MGRPADTPPRPAVQLLVLTHLQRYIHLRCLREWQHTLRCQGARQKAQTCDLCCARYQVANAAPRWLTNHPTGKYIANAAWVACEVCSLAATLCRPACAPAHLTSQDRPPIPRPLPLETAPSRSPSPPPLVWVALQTWQFAVLAGGVVQGLRSGWVGMLMGATCSWSHVGSMTTAITKWVPELIIVGVLAPGMQVGKTALPQHASLISCPPHTRPWRARFASV